MQTNVTGKSTSHGRLIARINFNEHLNLLQRIKCLSAWLCWALKINFSYVRASFVSYELVRKEQIQAVSCSSVVAWKEVVKLEIGGGILAEAYQNLRLPINSVCWITKSECNEQLRATCMQKMNSVRACLPAGMTEKLCLESNWRFCGLIQIPCVIFVMYRSSWIRENLSHLPAFCTKSLPALYKQ